LGTLEIPENIYAAISHKIRSLGSVQVY
jgi:hypothetical protein